MAAYVVVETSVTDVEKARGYMESSTRVAAQYGGRFLARGGELTFLEGDWRPQRLVILEFPSMEQAREWYRSAEYTAARLLREGAGTWRMVIVNGL